MTTRDAEGNLIIPAEAFARAREQRFSPGATDQEIARSFIHGCANKFHDDVTEIALTALIAQVRGDERRRIEASHKETRGLLVYRHTESCSPIVPVTLSSPPPEELRHWDGTTFRLRLRQPDVGVAVYTEKRRRT